MIKKILFFLFFIVYLPFFLVSFLAAAVPFIPVKWFPALQFIPLAVQYLAPLHLVVLILLSNKRWKTRLIALAAFLACGWILSKEYRLDLSAGGDDKDVRVISYNVRSFHYAPNKYMDRVGALFQPLDADIICFQEFYNTRLKGRKERVLEVMAQKMGMPYFRFFGGNGDVGGAVLSKYPLGEVESLFYSKNTANIGMYVEAQTPKGVLGIYNVHFASFRFGNHLPGSRSKDWKKVLKAIYQRAEDVIPDQQAQAHLVLTHIETRSHPFFLAGDMNSLPHSHLVSLFSKNYEDSFIKAGSGYGATYKIKGPLGMRIDYFFLSDALRTETHDVIPSDVSDHYPIVGEFSFKESQ